MSEFVPDQENTAVNSLPLDEQMARGFYPLQRVGLGRDLDFDEHKQKLVRGRIVKDLGVTDAELCSFMPVWELPEDVYHAVNYYPNILKTDYGVGVWDVKDCFPGHVDTKRLLHIKLNNGDVFWYSYDEQGAVTNITEREKFLFGEGAKLEMLEYDPKHPLALQEVFGKNIDFEQIWHEIIGVDRNEWVLKFPRMDYPSLVLCTDGRHTYWSYVQLAEFKCEESEYVEECSEAARGEIGRVLDVEKSVEKMGWKSISCKLSLENGETLSGKLQYRRGRFEFNVEKKILGYQQEHLIDTGFLQPLAEQVRDPHNPFEVARVLGGIFEHGFKKPVCAVAVEVQSVDSKSLVLQFRFKKDLYNVSLLLNDKNQIIIKANCPDEQMKAIVTKACNEAIKNALRIYNKNVWPVREGVMMYLHRVFQKDPPVCLLKGRLRMTGVDYGVDEKEDGRSDDVLQQRSLSMENVFGDALRVELERYANDRNCRLDIRRVSLAEYMASLGDLDSPSDEQIKQTLDGFVCKKLFRNMTKQNNGGFRLIPYFRREELDGTPLSADILARQGCLGALWCNEAGLLFDFKQGFVGKVIPKELWDNGVVIDWDDTEPVAAEPPTLRAKFNEAVRNLEEILKSRNRFGMGEE